ncbi:hypothetical protein ACIPY5_19925 [Microbacterium sp. NPDC089698]|uniref:hypothetical protein n=1 Tax=Microbacterium sp. NPDC089698 TaxID=3364200 RepID=UPI00381B5ACE
MSAPTVRIRAHHVSPARLTARTRRDLPPVARRQAVRPVMSPSTWAELIGTVRRELGWGLLILIGSFGGLAVCAWMFVQRLVQPSVDAYADFLWILLTGAGSTFFVLCAMTLLEGVADLVQELRDLRRKASKDGAIK